jgi:N-acetylglucosamine-6-phosphate deacetylase
MELIPALVENGIVPAVGHSDASYDQVRRAAELGLNHACHLFNAMGSIGHREPGTAGACLMIDSISVQVIPDGVHIHPDILRLTLKLKPPGSVALITDAVRAAGLGDGDYDMMGEPIKVRDGRVTDSRGKLAGSALTMPEALRNITRFTGIDLPEASALVSANPAAVLGDGDRGTIAPGNIADLVFLSKDLEVVAVMRNGRIIDTVER